MTLRLSQEMQRAEDVLGKPLARQLRIALNEEGVVAVAQKVGVNRATVRQWMWRLHIEQRYVDLGPDGRYKAEI